MIYPKIQKPFLFSFPIELNERQTFLTKNFGFKEPVGLYDGDKYEE